ncbi:uncharacterized protein LOC144355657, partial [Saccoglossus kowalevskii]
VLQEEVNDVIVSFTRGCAENVDSYCSYGYSGCMDAFGTKYCGYCCDEDHCNDGYSNNGVFQTKYDTMMILILVTLTQIT